MFFNISLNSVSAYLDFSETSNRETFVCLWAVGGRYIKMYTLGGVVVAE